MHNVYHVSITAISNKVALVLYDGQNGKRNTWLAVGRRKDAELVEVGSGPKPTAASNKRDLSNAVARSRQKTPTPSRQLTATTTSNTAASYDSWS